MNIPRFRHLLQLTAVRNQLVLHEIQNPGEIYIIAGGMDSKVLAWDWESERHPDICVYLSAPPKEDASFWTKWVPEIIVEIVSRGSRNRDYKKKAEEYLSIGVKEYWIVDVEQGKITILQHRAASGKKKSWAATILTKRNFCQAFNSPAGRSSRQRRNLKGADHATVLRLQFARARHLAPQLSSGQRRRSARRLCGHGAVRRRRSSFSNSKNASSSSLSPAASASSKRGTPSPARNTGGPFQAIPTTVPGTHISELLPYTARQMHRLAIVRSVNTAEDDHGKGRYIMQTGRGRTRPRRYPHLGSVAGQAARQRGQPAARLHSRRPARRARLQSQRCRLSRPALRLRYACRRQPPAEPAAAADADRAGRRTDATNCAPASTTASRRRRRSADTEAYTRTRTLRPRRSWLARNLFDLAQGADAAAANATAITSSAGTACSPAGCSKRASPSSRSRTPTTTRTTRTSTSTSSSSANSTSTFAHADRRSRPARPAGEDAGRRDVGVWPHADDQPQLWPRSLVARPGRSRWPAAASAAAPASAGPTTTAPRSPIARSTAATCSTPTSALSASTRRATTITTAGRFPMADPQAAPIQELLA